MATEARSGNGRPRGVSALLVVLAFLGVSALVGGGQFLLDPSGDSIGMPTSALAGSPFADFLVPGLILFAVLGVYPLAVAYGLRGRRRWAWPATVSVGVATVVWIAVQGAIIGFGHWLQWLYLLVGVAILGLALLPSVRRYGDARWVVGLVAGR